MTEADKAIIWLTSISQIKNESRPKSILSYRWTTNTFYRYCVDTTSLFHKLWGIFVTKKLTLLGQNLITHIFLFRVPIKTGHMHKICIFHLPLFLNIMPKVSYGIGESHFEYVCMVPILWLNSQGGDIPRCERSTGFIALL